MRNILIHEYFGIDLKIIWHTIVEDLPKLKVQVRGLLPQADEQAYRTTHSVRPPPVAETEW
jgi:uncharacterized protein with HEPN domain